MGRGPTTIAEVVEDIEQTIEDSEGGDTAMPDARASPDPANKSHSNARAAASSTSKGTSDRQVQVGDSLGVVSSNHTTSQPEEKRC